MISNLKQEIEAVTPEIVAIRRDIHQHAETGFQEFRTSKIIKEYLKELNLDSIQECAGTGVIATLKGGKPGKRIMLLADIDALPITEQTGLPFASKNDGCMHACGHDSHAAMLLGALKVLKAHEKDIPGTVKFVFQTGEEISKGAKIAIKEGVMDGVDAVFGMHIGSIISPDLPAGTLIVVPGCCMASFDRFVLKVKGMGCHGSTPEKGVDPITIASHIVISLQEVIAREIAAPRPAVLTVGKIAGGFAFNVIPSEVEIEGTIRAFEDEVRQHLAKRIGEISSSVAATFRGSCDYEMDWGAPPVVNDDAMAKLAGDAAKKALGAEHVITEVPSPNMGGEDFAYYLEQKPGAFMFLSSANPAKNTNIPHHNPKFDLDEDVFYKGSAVFVAIVEDFLGC
jgi:amidohydrolase